VTTIEKPNDDLKARLEELIQENRLLKRSVNDAQTSVALQRSEVATLRVQLEEKCYELET
jgi:exoribonuclease II